MVLPSANLDPLTRRVVALIHAGLTLDQIAQDLGVHRSSVYRRKVAAGVPRRWRPLTDRERERIRTLIDADYSRRQVAAIVGRGLGTVARLAARRPDLDGEDEYQATRHVRLTYRCPQCGHLVQIAPCLICAARRR